MVQCFGVRLKTSEYRSVRLDHCQGRDPVEQKVLEYGAMPVVQPWQSAGSKDAPTGIDRLLYGDHDEAQVLVAGGLPDFHKVLGVSLFFRKP